MSKQVLFIRGGGEGAHEEDARLVVSLASKLGENYEIRYPGLAMRPGHLTSQHRASGSWG